MTDDACIFQQQEVAHGIHSRALLHIVYYQTLSASPALRHLSSRAGFECKVESLSPRATQALACYCSFHSIRSPCCGTGQGGKAGIVTSAMFIKVL